MDLMLINLLFPFIGALFLLLFQDKISGIIAFCFALITCLLGILSIYQSLFYSKNYIYAFSLFKWLDINLNFSLINDPLTSIMMILILVIGFFIIFYSNGYMSPENADFTSIKSFKVYYFFLLIFIGAMIGVVSSGNLIQLFFFWEITTLCSWVLISFKRDSKSLFSGLKAFIMTHFGGFCFLIALAIIFFEMRSFEFSAINSLPYSSKFLVVLLLFFAASAKSAQIPLFSWLPDAMVAPTPVSAYLHAAAMVKAGVYLFARIYISNPNIIEDSALIICFMSISTMIFSVILYYFQQDLKKLLAYSTIGHLGYIFLGVSFGILGSKIGGMGGIFHIINHGFAKGLLFLTVGAIAYSTGSKDIKELSGIMKKFPLYTFCFMVGMFAIIGIPPFSGFWSKFMIFTGAFELKNIYTYVFGLLALFESVLSFCWYIFVAHRILFGEISLTVSLANKELPLSIRLSLIFMLILTILSPVIGYPLLVALFRNY